MASLGTRLNALSTYYNLDHQDPPQTQPQQQQQQSQPQDFSTSESTVSERTRERMSECHNMAVNQLFGLIPHTPLASSTRNDLT
ncbi:hypothetical protein Pmani_019801 [Petrolisthes manimaculis]|uniref:Uncharacterized protein n=1 Tax=Petrolisthes manimaculis TaxID=1843537 RepID=A0AAE1PHK3_9EUCA|nr:hypothetical protein Pmani_019801 [Petrolisthes manimaculis]